MYAYATHKVCVREICLGLGVFRWGPIIGRVVHSRPQLSDPADGSKTERLCLGAKDAYECRESYCSVAVYVLESPSA